MGVHVVHAELHALVTGNPPCQLVVRTSTPSGVHQNTDWCSQCCCPSAAMADDALDEKAKRVRSLLSSYYGTDGAGAGASAGGAGAPRLASIDSAAFDSRQFMLALVRLNPVGCLR